MRRFCYRVSLVLFPLLFAIQLPAFAQDRQGDPAQAIASYERYLERKPYHDWAFDKLVETAVSINGLAELVASYEERTAAGSSDDQARVILARLYWRTDQHVEALETLESVGEKNASFYRLVGALELTRQRTPEAIAALDQAAQLTEVREELEAIHELRGEAYLADGQRDKAYEAFHALTELQPSSFPLRLEAASTLALNGLHAEALIEFEVAKGLAGNDTARRCRVLSETGKLHEALSEGEAALAAYREAIEQMARGNWLKRDLYERILALHKRTGLLERLLEQAAIDASANAQDLDAREFHARVLQEAGRPEEAREALAAATEEFPADLRLSRQLIELLRTLEDADGMIVEYQRILEARPDELELYLELGQVFASAGRFEQAKRQWARTLEQRLTDPGLCVRLAGLYALYDQPEDSVAMYEKAIELEPAELRHYAELATFLSLRDRADEVPPLLARARTMSDGSAGRLEELSAIWREHGHLDQAMEAIEAALVVADDDPALLHRLADLQIASGEVEAATETLHTVINLATESNLRKSAVDRLLRIFYRDDRTDELVAMEEAAIEGGSTGLAPYLVLGKIWVQRRQPDLAIGYLERILEIDAENEDARLSLASLYEAQGDWDIALEHYEALMEVRPQNRRKYLKAVAKIHLDRYDQDAAFACYEEILAAAPDNPAAFLEVSGAYQRLGMLDESAECLRQAVRLDPDDGRTRLKLAEALRQLGELDKAEREILAAVDTKDKDTSENARERYYELLSSGGRIGTEIEALRARIDENPYDIASPLTLTDIYVRELEYELALEMLEKLITYQPSESRLLRERARMLALMERFDEAIVDYETLWKLPDADQRSLALDIADAALEQGDRARAEQVLTQVGDPQRIAALYKKKERWDDAIATLEKGLAANPTDGRLLSSLARLHEARGDEDSAIEVLERALALRSDSWKLIARLGTLYHEAGRKEDALESGRQLFALIRVEEDEDEDEDEETTGNNSSRYYGSTPAWARNRVYDIQNYFREKNLTREFAEIAADEALLQPTNQNLFQVAVSALQQEKDKGERAAELVAAVRAATLDRDRIPPATTRKGWERRLDSMRIGVYRNDVAFAEAHIAELSEILAIGSADVSHYLELAQVQSQLSKSDDSLATLLAGAERFPESTNLLAATATVLTTEKRYEEALAWYERLIERVVATPPDEADEETFRREITAKSGKQSLLQQFPLEVRRRVSDADLERFRDLTRGRKFYLPWGIGTVQYEDGARIAYARCLGKADRDADAATVLAALADDEGNSIGDLATLGNTYFELDLFEPARAIYEGLAAREAELSADPLFGFNRVWQRTFTTPMQNLARIYEKEAEVLLAYDLLLSYGNAAAGELLLTTADAIDEAHAFYEERVSAEEAVLATREAEADTSTGAVDSDAWRDANVRLAEICQIQKRWDDAIAVYARIEERRPDDFEVLSTVAALHERAGRVEDAVAVHFRAIDRKRELNRRPYRPSRPPGRVLTPSMPPVPEDENWAWQNLRNSVRYSYYGPSPSTKRFSYRDNYVGILKVYLDQGLVVEAAEVMRDLAREDVQTFSWLGYSLAEVIEQYRLGPAAIPILRMVYDTNSTYDGVALQYGKALVSGKKLDEGRRILGKLIDKSASNSYYGRQAREILDALDAREGAESQETLADMQRAVEDDPKNVKTRMKLARRLMKVRDFESALASARVAAELAPHKEDVQAFLRDCLQLTGAHEELEQQMLEELDDIQDDQKRFETAARVANWMWERGDKDAVGAVFEKATSRSQRNYQYYTSAGWYVEKGEFERAREVLKEEIARAEEYRQGDMKLSLAAVELALGDPLGVLDEVWEQEFEKASALGAKSAVLTRLATSLRDFPRLRSEAEELAQRCAEKEGMQGELYSAALEIALGELDACSERLTRLADPEGDTRFLYPVLVTLARAQDDLPRALELLEELYRLGIGSESDHVQTSLGYLSEKDALRAELGSLRLAVGQREAALEIWDEMYDPDESAGWSQKARLLAKHELVDEAAAMQRRYLEEVGERNAGDLQFLAELETQRGDHDAAIELYRRAIILSKDNESGAQEMRNELLNLYRRVARVDDYVRDLETRLAADPDDIDLRKRLVRMYAEAGDEGRALAELEALIDKPGLAKAILPTLIERALAVDDEEQAIAWSRRLLDENMETYERQQAARRFANLLLRSDKVDEAIEVLLASYDDPDSKEAHYAVGSLLESNDLAERSLPHRRRAVELDPDDRSSARYLAGALWTLEHFDELRALVIESLEDPMRRGSASGLLGYYSRSLDDSGERERVAAALAERPDDTTLLLLAAQIAQMDEEPERAIELYEKILAHDPDDRLVLQLLQSAYEGAKRWQDVLALIERMLPVVDREQGVSGVTASFSVTSLRRKRASMLLRLEQLDAAEAAFSDTLGMRFARISGYNYRYGSFRPAPPTELLRFYEAREDWERCLEVLAEKPRFVTPDANERDTTDFELRFRAGEREVVLEELWRLVYDPAAPLFDQGRESYTFYGRPENMIRQRNPMGTLVRLHRENGTVDELIERVEAAIARDPHLIQLSEFHRLLLAAEERWDVLLPHKEKEIAEDPYHPELCYELGEMYRRAGRFEDAIAMLERAQDVYRGRSFDEVTGWSYHERMDPYGAGSAKPVRFGFTLGSSQSFSGGRGWSSYGFSTPGWGAPHDAVRRELCGLYMKVGRTEDALALEEVEEAARQALSLSGRTPASAMSAIYEELELWSEVERLRLAKLESDLADVQVEDFESDEYGTAKENAERSREGKRGATWQDLARMWRKAGDEERRREYAARHIAYLDAGVERAGREVGDDDTDEKRAKRIAYARLTRAHFVAELGDDPAAARADLEHYLASLDQNKPLRDSSIAWTWYRIGEPERALEIYEAEKAERLLTTWSYSYASDYGIGLCLARQGEIERGRPRLMRALAARPDDSRAKEARDVLGLR